MTLARFFTAFVDIAVSHHLAPLSQCGTDADTAGRQTAAPLWVILMLLWRIWYFWLDH